MQYRESNKGNRKENRTMRKEKISIGKIDASREREFLEKYNLLGDNLLGGIEQEYEHEQIGEYKNTAIKNKLDKSMNKSEL